MTHTLKALSIFCLFTLFSCKQEQKEIIPIAKATYKGEGVAIKSYDYNQLKHLLERKNDTVYVVNFWATWCVPCVAELPEFEKLQANYKDKKVKVLLVSLDMTKMIEKQLIPFVINKKIQSQVVILDDPDANSWIEKINKDWSGAIPATYIYSKDKNAFFEQSFDYATLEKEMKTFLK
ncbi:TlpA disulfide reductase family protein [Flavobacterium sp. '19STA2R22 D10 B1']|uniref:TlpA disulfide reductase family protein n=1 Tax=Flavobacterium aerium TaxID=3037261 RepID=UPI00278C13B7|nr:TlpA disulfide reductase family protein [Flavobacterium sp. '19STA2R22 D10 B1']